jgi:hypothetical protein
VIHFWLPSAPSSSEILAWDPETEPRRYASGVGHNIYELFNRLARSGVDVTLGTDVRPNARLTVLYAPSIEVLSARKRAVDVIRRTMGRYALIRADAPVSFRLPVRPVADFVPIASAVRDDWQRCLPPLPQRGLVPRSAERHGQVRSVAFKGNPENVPSELKAGGFIAALASRGISCWLDVPATTDGPDQSWHDFAAVDAVLCLRNPAKRRDLERKPATKLLNAWSAGCIPLVEPEPGYLELARDGEDAFVVEDPTECLDVFDLLMAHPKRIRHVESQIGRRRADFATDVVLALWKDALEDACRAAKTRGWRRGARTVRATAAQVRGVLRRS